MEINQAQMTLEISMYAEKAAQTFIEGVFQEQSFYINHGQYRQNYKVRSIKVMETPRFENTMHYKTLSPILLSFSDENKNEVYMRPDHPEYGLKLAYNLINKLNAIQAEHQITENDISFLLTGDFKKNGITIKENSQNPTQLIGYLFPFTLKAPPEIHEIAYNAGVGKENSQGFGCVEIVTQNRNQHG
jgi:CRISPR-associated endoribonuclease Cas6